MNADKWQRATAHRLVVKLSEETGEVAKAYLDAVEALNDVDREKAKEAMVKELAQVQFIASVLNDKIMESPKGFMNPTPDEDDNGA